MTERICAHNNRVWFICWPSEHGLVPLESHSHIHKHMLWHFYVQSRREGPFDDASFTQADAEAEGYVAKRFWLSLKNPKGATQ